MSETLQNLVPGQSELAPPATLTVDLVGDVICPFTYLGKRRLDEAMSYVHGPVKRGWYPFQLNPDMPEEGESFEAYLASRFGSQAAIQPVLDRLQAEGRDVGIEYDFDAIRHVPNTLPVHQVIQLAEQRGHDDVLPMVEAFMEAYLARGENIGDEAVIVEIARRFRLSADDVRSAMTDELSRKAVQTREEHIRETGITGVPGFLMNERLLLVGVQEIPGIVAGFDRAMFGDADGKPVEAPVH